LNERLYHAIKSLIDKGKEHEGCIFLKQMAKFAHLFNFNTNWEAGDINNSEANQWKDKCLKLISESNIEIQHYHVILIRDPVSCVGSWVAKSGYVHNNNLHPDEVGVNQLLEVYSKVTENQSIVIDCDDLASCPSKVLQELCVAVGIEYSEQMSVFTIVENSKGSGDCKIFCLPNPALAGAVYPVLRIFGDQTSSKQNLNTLNKLIVVSSCLSCLSIMCLI